MLSTPVWGVDSRKEIVAPLLAPCLCNDMETGITPHEHSGNGMPKRLALSRGPMPCPPRCRSTMRCETKTDNSPATRKPHSRYGDISATVAQKSTAICLRISGTACNLPFTGLPGPDRLISDHGASQRYGDILEVHRFAAVGDGLASHTGQAGAA